MFVQTFTTASGVDIIAASVPAGEIAAVSIDNPSGAWIFLPSLREYIPPYTLGWVRILDIWQASFTLQFVPNGPDGTASIFLGDPIKLVLYDVDAAKGLSGTSQGTPFTPIARKQTFTTVAFGNLGATAFTGANAGRLIAGVIIDNPSGSWLTLTAGGAGYRIAPYQLRWVKRIDPPTLQIDSLTFDAAGPSNQVSTLAGDQVSVTILDLPPDSADTQYVEGFTPVNVGVDFVTWQPSTPILNRTIIAPVANKRLRLLWIAATLEPAFQFSIDPNDIAYITLLRDDGATFILGITAGALTAVFPVTIDLPRGVGVHYSINDNGLYKDVTLVLSIGYQVI